MINTSRIALAGVCAVGLAVALSFVHPFGDPRAKVSLGADMLAGADIPAELREVVRHKCGNCHSEAVDWPFYAHVAPVSWLLERDVTEAREHMNLSGWSAYSNEEKSDLLTRLAAEVRSGEMPPARYTAMHRDSKLLPQERESLYEWARAERKRIRASQQTVTGE
jgi:cytochrome c